MANPAELKPLLPARMSSMRLSQIRGLHIGKRDANDENRGQLLGGDQNDILA